MRTRDGMAQALHKVRSPGQEALRLQLMALKIPHEMEYRFDEVMKWRFDFAIPEKRIAIEVEGGIWINGRHNRGAGMAKDLEKYDAAMRQGWSVYRCSTEMATSGHAIETIQIMLGLK